MKILFIGGTGLISSAVTPLVLAAGHDLTLFNRGRDRQWEAHGANIVVGDARDPAAMKAQWGNTYFDVVVDWIAFTPDQVRQDIDLWSGRCGQYVFISSASAYQKPVGHYKITESTPLHNPYWQYSRDKIACEELLTAAWRETGFPMTIVRPSHTYGQGKIPFPLSTAHTWTILERMRRGDPVIVPGDGTSLWTMTHNTDFARGFAGLLGLPRAVGNAYHITGDDAMTWNNAVRTVAAALGVEARLMPLPSWYIEQTVPGLVGSLLGDKCESVVFDNSKIRDAVPGFVCTVTFAEGVRRELAYLEAHPELQVVDPNYDRDMETLLAGFPKREK